MQKADFKRIKRIMKGKVNKMDWKKDAKETLEAITESVKKTGKATKEQFLLYGASLAILADDKPTPIHATPPAPAMPTPATAAPHDEIADMYTREMELAQRYAWLAENEKNDRFRTMGKQSLEHAGYFIDIARGTRGVNPDVLRKWRQEHNEMMARLG